MPQIKSGLDRIARKMKPKKLEWAKVIDWESLEDGAEVKERWELVDTSNAMSWEDVDDEDGVAAP